MTDGIHKWFTRTLFNSDYLENETMQANGAVLRMGRAPIDADLQTDPCFVEAEPKADPKIDRRSMAKMMIFLDINECPNDAKTNPKMMDFQ